MIDDKDFADLKARVERLEKASGVRSVDDFKVDIDDPKYGDPPVFQDPSRWVANGHPVFKGKPYSTCPPDYLENLSKFLMWQADMDDKAGKVDRNGKAVGWRKRRDAAKAKAWAERKRAAGEKDCIGVEGAGNDASASDADLDF